jgi:cytochrome c-type biogenesis protein CcmE
MTDLNAPTQQRASGKRTRFVVGGAAILAVIAWLILSNIGAATTPYVPVGEVVAAGPSDRLVRAVGDAQAIAWDAEALLLRFEIADDSGSLSVTFKGVRPDLLVEGTRTVVEGKYLADGTFQASQVLTQCPSKYQEE